MGNSGRRGIRRSAGRCRALRYPVIRIDCPVGPGVVDSLDEPFPVLHLVDFIQDEQIRVEGPRLIADDSGIIEIIVIQVLGIPEFFHQFLGQPGFADLPRPGQYNHLLREIPLDRIIQIAIHIGFISTVCTKVKTIMQNFAVLDGALLGCGVKKSKDGAAQRQHF